MRREGRLSLLYLRYYKSINNGEVSAMLNNRRMLNAWGSILGVPRNMLGLEPNFIYRKRILRSMENLYTGPLIKAVAVKLGDEVDAPEEML